MTEQEILALQAARKITPTQENTIYITVQKVINETAKAWSALFETKIAGAVLLTGKSSNAGVVPLGVSVDLKLFNKAAVDIAKMRTAKIQMEISKTTLKRVSDAVAAGIEEGHSREEVAVVIRELFDNMGKTRSELIAQVETGIAASKGDFLNAQMTNLDLVKMWSSAKDEKVRESHQIDGETADMQETFSNGLMYPLDENGPIEEIANCFIGETNIESPDASALFRQWYDGEIITIKTASGIKLTGTPNHPIATIFGWKPLGLLNERDYVISGRFDQVGLALIDPHGNQMPSGLQDFYAAATTFNKGQRIRNRNVNFHGDRGTGDVDYISLDWMLRDGGDAADTEPANHVQFASADLAFTQRSGSDEMLTVSSNGVVGGLGQRRPLLGSRLLHSQQHALASITGLKSARKQSSNNNTAIGSKFPSNRLNRLAIVEPAHNVVAVKDGSISRPLQFPFSETLGNQRHATSELVCALLKRQSVLAGADQVLSVKRSDFSGHVYTLQTQRGYYIANGIITRNCRCCALYVPVDEVDQWTS